MPRQVDHEQRRREVAEAACELIARDGVDAVTVRGVAEAVECSTTVVSHYFANKHELLLFAYRAAAEKSQARIAAVMAKDSANLQGCLEALMPLDHDRRRDWSVWFALWGLALGNSAFGQEHRAHFRAGVELIAEVARVKWDGKDHPGDWYRTEAQRLFALVSGIAAQAVFDPAAFTSKKMRDIVVTEIARIESSWRERQKQAG